MDVASQQLREEKQKSEVMSEDMKLLKQTISLQNIRIKDLSASISSTGPRQSSSLAAINQTDINQQKGEGELQDKASMNDYQSQATFCMYDEEEVERQSTVVSKAYKKELDHTALETLALSIVAVKYDKKQIPSSTDTPNSATTKEKVHPNSFDSLPSQTEIQNLKDSEEPRKKAKSDYEKVMQLKKQIQKNIILHQHNHEILKKQSEEGENNSSKANNNDTNNKNDNCTAIISKSHKRMNTTHLQGSPNQIIGYFGEKDYQSCQKNLGSLINSLGSTAVSTPIVPFNGGTNDEATIQVKLQEEQQEQIERSPIIFDSVLSESPKDSEDNDMFQPFSHFFVIGCEQSDLNEFEANESVDRIILPAKLLYSYEDPTKNADGHFDVIKQQVGEQAFPFGVEARKLVVSDESEVLNIQQTVIMQTRHRLSDKFFCFKMRSQENFKLVSVEKQKNDLLKLVNPNKTLFFTCLQVRDYFETTPTNATGPQRVFWRHSKIMCFVSYFPFFELHSRLLESIQDHVKVDRQFAMLKEVENKGQNKQQLGGDYLEKFVFNNMVGSLSAWQNIEMRGLGQDYSFVLDTNDVFSFSLPLYDEFRAKTLAWSLIGPLNVMSFSNFLFILFAVMMEQHVVFLSNQICLLTKAISCFESCIMPFQWPFAIIYTLPENLLGMIGSPQPIILGINKSGRYAINEDLFASNPDSIFVLLDEGTIVTDNSSFVSSYSGIRDALELRTSLVEKYELINKDVQSLEKVVTCEQFARASELAGSKSPQIAPKFHCSQGQHIIYEDILSICHETFKQKIIAPLPKIPPFIENDTKSLDFQGIHDVVSSSKTTVEKDKEFVKRFCSRSSQTFIGFCEDFYNITEDQV